MKRLRHPIRAIREPFGTAGLVVACVALIAALGGTAFAAAKLNSTQKKEVTKIAKKYAGKPGAPGAAGPAGPAGPQGPAGAKGDAGAKGTDGTDGTDGESVVVNSYEGPECPTEEGAEVKNNSGTVYVCNGEEGFQGTPGTTGAQGPTGPAGSPWTAGGTLPPGSTETGTWAFNGTSEDTEGIRTAISFPIRLAKVIPAAHVHFGEAGNGDPAFEAACPATGSLSPKAEPGELCVYPSSSEGLENATFDGAFKLATFTGKGATAVGAMLKFTPAEEAVAFGAGTFAVTGCDPTPGATEFACPE